jgi:hypothetical protein
VERPELELVLKDVAGDEDGVGELARAVEAPDLSWVVELPGDRELAMEDAAEDKDVDICEVVAELIPELVTEPPVAEAIMLEALETLDVQPADVGKFVTPLDAHSSFAYAIVACWSAGLQTEDIQHAIPDMNPGLEQMQATSTELHPAIVLPLVYSATHDCFVN